VLLCLACLGYAAGWQLDVGLAVPKVDLRSGRVGGVRSFPGSFQSEPEDKALHPENYRLQDHAIHDPARVLDDGVFFGDVGLIGPWMLLACGLGGAGTFLCCLGGKCRTVLGLVLLVCCLPVIFIAGHVIVPGGSWWHL
jgi:hypothetical protein